jgi:hypothetical protein
MVVSTEERSAARHHFGGKVHIEDSHASIGLALVRVMGKGRSARKLQLA